MSPTAVNSTPVRDPVAQVMADSAGKYRLAVHGFGAQHFEDLSVLKPTLSGRALAEIWVVAIALIATGVWALEQAWGWWLYPPLAFFIAGRQGALLQIVHEGTHGLLSRKRSVNDFLGNYLAALPVGITLQGYARGHMTHHAHTNTDLDPASDREKYVETDWTRPKLYLLFLRDLVGFSALISFFAYKQNELDANARAPAESPVIRQLKTLLQLAFVQLVLLAVVFQFDWKNYLLFWIVPIVSAHMVLMRLRGIAEHGYAKQRGIVVNEADQGNYYTRSMLSAKSRYRFGPLNFLERALIGSLCVNYHHEHHLCPKVPFYNLPTVHERLADRVAARNPDVYVPGYLAAAFHQKKRP